MRSMLYTVETSAKKILFLSVCGCCGAGERSDEAGDAAARSGRLLAQLRDQSSERGGVGQVGRLEERRRRDDCEDGPLRRNLRGSHDARHLYKWSFRPPSVYIRNDHP